MDIFQAIILGIIQGLTEFLPISSSAHVRVIPALLGWADPGAPFAAAIQISTTLAVIIYFWRDLTRIVAGWFKSFRGGESARTVEARLGWAIVVGTIPIGILGFLFKDNIETTFRSLYIVAYSLIALALVLGLAELLGKRTEKLQDVGIGKGLWIGLWQALALVPGMSRSGSTITAGLFAGLDRESAARFSFLMSVPSILGAAAYSLKSHASELLHDSLASLIVANIAGFLSGLLGIAFLMRYLQTRSTLIFIIYRIVAGCILLWLLRVGKLSP